MALSKQTVLRFLFWAEIVIGVKIVLFDAPLITQSLIIQQADVAMGLSHIMRFLISVPALFYVIVGVLSLSGNTFWKSLHYVVAGTTIILNGLLLGILTVKHIPVTPVYTSPSLFSVLLLVWLFLLTRNDKQVKHKRILLVDDDPGVSEVIRPMLNAHSFFVDTARTGEDGLELARRNSYDLIILDVILPGIKGRGVCEQLKQDPETKDIPIIFLTAKNSPDDVEAELSAGAIGHFSKPIESQFFISEIKRILQV